MALKSFPVVLPFQSAANSPDVPTLAVDAAATTTSSALAVANAFSSLICQLRYQRPPHQTFLKLARIGAPGTSLRGTYGYAIGTTNNIALVPLSKEYNKESVATLRQQLQGLAAGGCRFLLIDAAQIIFSDTSALDSLGQLGESNQSSRHIGIHFFRLSEPNKKIFDIVGLNKLIGSHANLSDAIAACELAVKNRNKAHDQKGSCPQ